MDDLILKQIFDRYNLLDYERKEIYEIIKNIYLHKEFQKRCTTDYLHHGSTTLGEHILEDTVVTYILLRDNEDNTIDKELALKIAMMHDLYTSPWQNVKIKKSSLFYKHGFSHPLEAVINSIYWFKDEFEDDYKAKVLIDGIIHHMYPLPVLSYKESKKNELELLNFKIIKNLSRKHRKMIYESSNKNKIGKVSLARSIYKEGRIMAKADKISSINQFTSLSDLTALVTGKNKRLTD